MNTVLWIVTILLAVLTFIPGIVKITAPREKLVENMPWVNDFNQNQLRAIGALEAAAAVGLIVPGIVGIAPILVPLAATGIVLIQLGAVVTHLKRKEGALISINVIMIAMAVFVAWGRFGSYPL